MASAYGANRNIVCPGCKLGYDSFRTGMSFTEVRRSIIAIGTDRKTGKTKYGRRSGVLGLWHEWKKMMWEQHVGDCTSPRNRRTA